MLYASSLCKCRAHWQDVVSCAIVMSMFGGTGSIQYYVVPPRACDHDWDALQHPCALPFYVQSPMMCANKVPSLVVVPSADCILGRCSTVCIIKMTSLLMVQVERGPATHLNNNIKCFKD